MLKGQGGKEETKAGREQLEREEERLRRWSVTWMPREESGEPSAEPDGVERLGKRRALTHGTQRVTTSDHDKSSCGK